MNEFTPNSPTRKGEDPKFKKRFTANFVVTTTTSTIPVVSFIRWATGAPATVATDQSFPLALEVTTEGRSCSSPTAAALKGEIIACSADTPLDLCEHQDPFTLTPSEGEFSGPPQTFAFSASRGQDCLGPQGHYLATQVFLADRAGNPTIGPFFGPPTNTQLLAPSTRSLVAGCGEGGDGAAEPLTFLGLTGSTILRHLLNFGSRCGEPFGWTIASSAPWLRATPAGGSTVGGCQEVMVEAHLAGLAPGTYSATLVVTAEGVAPLTMPVTLEVAGGVSIAVTPALPLSVGTGETFSRSLLVSGVYDSGQLYFCPIGRPFEECSSGSPLEVVEPEGGGFFEPGTLTVKRGDDCLTGGGYDLVAGIFFPSNDESGLQGPFLTSLGSTSLRASVVGGLDVSERELTFNATATGSVSPHDLQLDSLCGQAVSWSVGASPGLTVTPSSGTTPGTDRVSVSVNPTASGAGTVTFTPSIGAPVVVNVKVIRRNDLTIVWSQGAPPAAPPGQSFTLTLDVTANATRVSGQVRACRASEPIDECFGGPFEFNGSFSGPPATFSFPVRRDTDCATRDTYQFVARVFVEDEFDFAGPFFGEPTQIMVEPPTAQALRVFPDTVVVNTYGRQAPPSQQLFVRADCGGTLAWTVSASAPWLQVTPTSGTTDGSATVLLGVDVSQLDANQSPYTATLTFSSSGAPSPVTVQVTVNLAC